jgi:LuxR family transcriptional regulator, maltose regulon positive regulatory protein
MSRALRYSPPVADQALIVRPRLLAQLRQRFGRPVTAIVAAPGFGKTTLLAQAIAENSLSPLGDDHWLTCQRDDVSLSFLAEGVFAAVGVTTPAPDDPNAAATAVADTIWSAAPRHLAIVFDDAHIIRPESPGATFLSGLVRELPRNGHVVLASLPGAPGHGADAGNRRRTSCCSSWVDPKGAEGLARRSLRTTHPRWKRSPGRRSSSPSGCAAGTGRPRTR